MTKILAWCNGKLKEFTKLEVHEKGLLHPAISVFIFCKDEVLLQRRALNKYHTPGLWTNACCSHPHPGENTKSCSERRLTEEMGIINISMNFYKTIKYRANVGNNLIENEVVDVFFGFVETKNKLNIEPNPQEVMDTKWISSVSLEKDIEQQADKYTPWLNIYVREHSVLRSQKKVLTN
tara:strand:- start:288 stop:824 length:537 start_codon:yes stop_codon:yes gene_type:complete